MLDPLLAELNTAAERIWLACQGHCPELNIEVRPELGSTNTELMARGRQGDVGPALLTALHQTTGRGRQGRIWQAEPGGTLTFSLGLPLRLDTIPGGGSALSLAVGLAVAEALDHGLRAWGAPAQAIGLKWPNDLWLAGRKLGGILIEATPSASLPPSQRWVVIGVGLNVRSAPPGAAHLAESLASGGAGTVPSTAETWAWIAPALIEAVAQFADTGFAPLQARYAARDVLKGQAVGLWTTPPATLPPGPEAVPQESGLALGVDAQGALQVETASGLRSWTTGEVSVRAMPA